MTQSSPGCSLTDVFLSQNSGIVNPARDHILVGKERHDVGRPHDWGFRVHGIAKGGMLYLRNFGPTRWPAGNPEAGYLNTDGSPTKTVILDGRTNPETACFWQWSFGKRPSEELYNVAKDPLCLHNLADRAEYKSVKTALCDRAFAEMKAQNDPRMFGRGHVFDEYPYADDFGRNFYERYVRGEMLRADWVNPTDFEKGPLGFESRELKAVARPLSQQTSISGGGRGPRRYMNGGIIPPSSGLGSTSSGAKRHQYDYEIC